MDIINRIQKPVNQNFNVYYQPPDSLRDSVNGTFVSLGNGLFHWENIKGNSLAINLSDIHIILGWCVFLDKLFILTLDINTDYIFLYQTVHSVTTSGPTSLTQRWTNPNSELTMSVDHPVRSMFGVDENQYKQNLYWTDYYNQPRCLNVAGSDPIMTISKFVDFWPTLAGAYGTFTYQNLITGGSLRAGNYFFCWQFYNDNGYFTDWSPLTTPVHISLAYVGASYDSHQDYQGKAPDYNSQKKVKINLSGMDSTFVPANIRIAAFYSSDLNSAEPGVIFYDGSLTAESMDFIYSGNENLGTVLLDDINDVSLWFEKIKDMNHLRNINVAAGITEREEIDVSTVHSMSKNNQMEVTVDLGIYQVPIDLRELTDVSIQSTWAIGDKSLFGMKSIDQYNSNKYLYPGIWYKATGNITINGLYSPYPTDSFVEDDRFMIDYFGIGTTSNFVPLIRKKLYRKASATEPYSDSDYVWDEKILSGHYFDYKNEMVANNLMGYPGDETIRLGILFFDITGRPFAVRYLYNTDETYGPGDITIPTRNGTFQLTTNFEQSGTNGKFFPSVNGNNIYLKISGIDITDIKDQISGFSIVRCPIIRQNLGMGLVCFTRHADSDILNYLGFVNISNDADRQLNTYVVYCPERLFGLTGFDVKAGDSIKNVAYYKVKEAAYDDPFIGEGYGEPIIDTAGQFYQKFLEYIAAPANTNGLLDAENELASVTSFMFGDDNVSYDPEDPTYLFKKEAVKPDGDNGLNSNCMIITTTNEETLDNPVGRYNKSLTAADGLIVSFKRSNIAPYGGMSDSDLANNIYIPIGHFQPVNPTVLANIYNAGDGTYIFNEIDVFGGDCMVQLFDICRVLYNFGESDQRSHTAIFPVESRINLGLREGVHAAKDRTYHSVDNTSGIRVNSGGEDLILEEFNYNDGYSSVDIGNFFIPLPQNYIMQNVFDKRFRYTNIKIPGEVQDNYRVFPVEQYHDLELKYGSITNIRSKFNQLIYWQQDSVGIVPINERQLMQNALGTPTQIGVGGVFERHDEISEYFLGNQNQFGLVESEMGFHWFDAKRKVYVTLDGSLKLTRSSIDDGLSNFFINTIPEDIWNYDNPINGRGITGGYDPKTKTVFHTIFYDDSQNYYTVGYSLIAGGFIGRFSFGQRWYAWLRNVLISAERDLDTAARNNIYVHGTGNYGSFYDGEYSDAYVTIIIKAEDFNSLIFDNFEILGNNNFFNTIRYKNTDQDITETCMVVGGTSSAHRNLTFRNNRWIGNFPLVNRKRLRADGYLEVTFTVTAEHNKLIKLTQIKTLARKEL